MIILDVETTGSDYKACSITQIAALEFERPENRFIADCRIWDGATIEPLAMSYNGYIMEELHDQKKKSDIDIVLEFLAWAKNVEEKTIVGENPAFDRDFMRFTLERNGKEWPLGFRTLDIHTISFLHHHERGVEIPHENGLSMLRLDATLNYVGLPEEQKPHKAINGMLLEVEAFSRLVYGKNLLPEFAKSLLPKHIKK